MVSRVSDAARSIGLPRLQRGGSSVSIAAIRSSGNESERQLGARERVGGEDTPPTGGGEHRDVRPVRERLGGEARRGFEGFFDGDGEVDARLSAHPREDALVARQRAGVRCGSLSAPGGGATLHEHEWLRSRRAAGDSNERAAVAHPFEVCEPHIGGGVGGEELEVVGDADDRRVSRRDCPADADPRAEREVLERRHDVARLARDADPARREGRARPSARTATTAWTRCPGRSGRPAGCRPPRRRPPIRLARAGPSHPFPRIHRSSRMRHGPPSARSRVRRRH